MSRKRERASEDEPASGMGLSDVARILSGAADVPRDFIAALYGHAAPEDLVHYSASELAALGRATFENLQERTPGEAKIRITNPAPVSGDGRLDTITVIEVVNDDMPFLLDSTMGEIAEQGLYTLLVVHPIFRVERSRDGHLTHWHGEAGPESGGLRESTIQIHVERIDAEQAAQLRDALANVLSEVRLAVADWREMRDQVLATIEDLKRNPPPLPGEEIGEAIAFLEWLAADNFTFLGTREYAFTDAPDRELLEPRGNTGLGILRNPDLHVLRRGGKLVTTTPALRAFLREPVPLIVTKANVRSRVHRRIYMDYIGVKRFDAAGALMGEFRIVGLFTSTAYTRRAATIPYLRHKVQRILDRAQYDPESHSGKALANVLETYPRDELFQIDEDLLYHFANEIVQLEIRPRVRVLSRRDRFDRFVSVLVFVPRERFDSEIRGKIGAFLAEAYQGRVSAFYPYFSDGPLTRVHFIIGRDEGKMSEPEQEMLEFAVERIVRDWGDRLAAELMATHEPAEARQLQRRYRDAFSAGYREAYPPKEALRDIRLIEGLSAEGPITAEFYRREGAAETSVHLQLFSLGRRLPLSGRVPVLENMGFQVVDERSFTIEPYNGEHTISLHDMALRRADGGDVDLNALSGLMESTLLAVLGGEAENDGYNALVLHCGLPWREVALVRTLSRYLRQARIPFSQDYLWTTLVRHAPITSQIVALFHARFDPGVEATMEERGAREAEIVRDIEQRFDKVQSLDEDQILRRFVNLVRAGVRTSFYQLSDAGEGTPVISIKFESRKIDGLPEPRPLYEIFVYSPRFEGVHMRFGKVARGGIRWSDRPQDFRTEILGLVKAQQVKNAVIVPFGAKGGFVPKHLPAGGSRDEVQAEGTACYGLFISSLLEITDNLGPDGTIPPVNVVRHDDDDPYLVVAADKGTATFSDLANSIALRRKFWLGDAFASGGSAGYDHKEMGITARGAWEAVERHFREMDVNIETTPITVAGVGDMSGDVFGNGMLLAKTIKLVAAFDHRDIFIDPNPDAERSFAERKRLFETARSTWQDYDRAAISKGGGVFSRSAKSVPLAEEARRVLGLDAQEATPAQIIKAILKANVDLLWFGGIGTYVRSSAESDDRVGDRANDAVRITGAEIRARVIGEGANLAMTQLGRVEAAKSGVRLNTDAIDNSAGVNSSDMEVNLKIALSIPVREERLTLESRNTLLEQMTKEVAALVLRNNYLQTLAISLAERRAAEDLGFEMRLMQRLERAGLLDRAVEFLPGDAELGERRMRGTALTRPELSVTLAYAKIALFGELLDSDVPDDPYLARELARYFPKPMSERFPEALDKHRLRREIIATMLANSMINRGGPPFAVRVADETGADSAAAAKAFTAVRDSYGLSELNGEIDGLDNAVAGELQLSLYAAVQDLHLNRINWFLRHVEFDGGLAEVVAHYRDGIAAMEAALEQALSDEHHAQRGARVTELISAGVPEPLARKLASLTELAAAPDIVMTADRCGKPIADVTGVYFAVGAYFRLDRITAAARGLDVADYFERLALDRAVVELASSQRAITAAALETGQTGQAAVHTWVAERGGEVERVRASVDEIAASGLTLSKLSVAAGLLADLVKT